MQGIYAITPDEDNDELLCNKVLAAIKGGIRIIQYRHSTASTDMLLRQALLMAAICHEHNTTLIINNRVDIAKTCSAAGVHLGVNDTSIATARSQLGQKALIGMTCHDSLKLANAAKKSGANYIGMGAIFLSPTKPNASRCSLEKLRQTKKNIDIPLVAIGGITIDNIPTVISTGVNCIAMASGLFNSQDITATSKKLTALFK